MKTKILFLSFILVLFGCNSGGGSGGGGTGGGGTGGGGTTPDPFQVTIYDPMDGVTDFGVDDSITVQFNNEISTSSVFYSGSSMDNVTVIKQEGAESVFIEVTVSGNMMTIQPMFSLEPNQTYSVSLDTTLMDMKGQYLQEAVTFSFRTAAEQGTNPGNQIMLSFSDRENEDRNIEVFDYRILYGSTQRVGNSSFAGYDFEVRIDRAEADAVYDPSTRRYTYVLDQNVQIGQSYYLSMKACNNVCSDFSEEIQKTVE